MVTLAEEEPVPLAFLVTAVIFILMHKISKGCHSVCAEIKRHYITHVADSVQLKSPNIRLLLLTLAPWID